MRMRSRMFATFAALALMATACGGDNGTDNGASANGEVDELLDDPDALHVLGTNDLIWDPDELSAEAGTITFVLECGQAVHDIVIEETDEEIARCSPNQLSAGEIDLDEGEYNYICTIPGHQNMRGTLTVT